MKPRQLLFSLPYGIGFRNIVCCGVLDACRALGAGATLLIPELSPADAQRIGGEIPPGIAVRELKAAKHSRSFTCLKLIKQHLYGQRTGLESFQVKRQRRRREWPLLHAAASVIERAAEMLCSEEWVDERIARARQPFEDYYERMLDELRIDTVVLAKPGYQPEDLALIRAARAHRVPTISVDTTWDNIVSKRPAYLAPDALTAWSRRMRDEAVEFYRLDPPRVPVTGGAPFDVFFARDRLPPRSAFLESLRLDPARPLIVFTLNNPLFNVQNRQLVAFLLDAVRRGAIRHAPNVLIRMHPWDCTSSHEDTVRRYSNVHLERPLGTPDPSSVYECIPTALDVVHYGALILVRGCGRQYRIDDLARRHRGRYTGREHLLRRRTRRTRAFGRAVLRLFALQADRRVAGGAGGPRPRRVLCRRERVPRRPGD